MPFRNLELAAPQFHPQRLYVPAAASEGFRHPGPQLSDSAAVGGEH